MNIDRSACTTSALRICTHCMCRGSSYMVYVHTVCMEGVHTGCRYHIKESVRGIHT